MVVLGRRFRGALVALAFVGSVLVLAGSWAFARTDDPAPKRLYPEVGVAEKIQQAFNEAARRAGSPARVVKNRCRRTPTLGQFDCRATVVGVGGPVCYAVLAQRVPRLRVVAAVRLPECPGVPAA